MSDAATEVSFPSRSVRIVEPFGPGGGPDLLARALATKLSERWKQPVVVENLTGAGATAAPAFVAAAPADGYTLLLNTSAQAYTAALPSGPAYDALEDFVPVAALTTQPYVLVTGRQSGLTCVGELVAAAQTKPGTLTFGSTGLGTGTHLGAVRFNREACIACVDVPPESESGIGGVLAGTVAGRTTYMFAPISAATLPLIGDGRLVPLGVTTEHRSPLLPDVPTIQEGGIRDFDFPIWYGLWAPAGTPPAVVDHIADAVSRLMDGPSLRAWVAEHGGHRMRMSRQQFSDFVREEARRASDLLKPAATD